MKELKEMLDQASLILNVNKQLEFFLENIHLCPEMMSFKNKVRFKTINAEIIRGEVFPEIEIEGRDTTRSMSLAEYAKRVRSGIWIEHKKMPKRKLEL